MKILENIPLADLTTFKIGGPARYFCSVTDVGELKKAFDFVGKHKCPVSGLPVFILGGGSNVLVSDDGFPGLVIKMEIKGIKAEEKTISGGTVYNVTAGAGGMWDDLVAFTVGQGLVGLENLSLIPGTVGAAPVQNIGAYGAEVKDVISAVEVFNVETGESRTMTNAECHFGYRDSLFKKPEGRKYIITHVVFRLLKNAPLKTDYKDIQEYLTADNIQLTTGDKGQNTKNKQSLTLEKLREIIINIRTNKLPDIKKNGTAGSFFKNPIISRQKYEELKQRHPDMPHFPVGTPVSTSVSPEASADVKISAAWLLDKLCGFKGYHDGSVGVYQNQALVLVNFGGARASDIIALAKKMADCVREKTGIELEKEVQIVE